ncbi:MAG TPA: dTDP-4-amino-4,6-dideoxygalactose transaminase [Bacteroidales bacterium]|nr:dTDP-4-amino-4,6-dideoxygalactose transaminase [Bacteroidales bacterium]HPS15939.1 dTDP-4-amino-4,6-dideoxygalactose transaminase [Bacteroidales bacterium]
MIPFNIPYTTGKENRYIRKALALKKFSGDGSFNKKCQELIEKDLSCSKVFLTPSGTAALEMAAILCNIKEGDEVIMPSFTFPSSANAFVLRGAKIVFVDINPKTMNIDENLIEQAITEKTKAIVVVHYAGIACNLGKIKAITDKNNLFLVEDAAHAFGAKYNDKYLGTIGDIGCISFHETKNIHCGEGGAIIINNSIFAERAEIIREKGTDRSKFKRGETLKYSWLDKGSSYLLSEINAAFLYAQLQAYEKVNKKRVKLFELYKEELEYLESLGRIGLPVIPDYCKHNGHIFYMKCKDETERNNLIDFLNKNTVYPAFHYLPLHSSKAGQAFGIFNGDDLFTTLESSKLLRLPMFYDLNRKEIKEIGKVIKRFYETKN